MIDSGKKLNVKVFLTETMGPNDTFNQNTRILQNLGQSYASWEWKSFCRMDDNGNMLYGYCKTGYGNSWTDLKPDDDSMHQ